MKKYRVECNFGSKYFDNAVDAFAYFHRCKENNCNVGIWLMCIQNIKNYNRVSIKQELLDYSFTHLPY